MAFGEAIVQSTKACAHPGVNERQRDPDQRLQ
jgi:hypothetical protein